MDALDEQIFAKLCAPYLVAGQLKHVAVAVSGGADSMCLALLLRRWCQAHGITLHALTVDHQLRQESGAEARAVHGILSDYGIVHTVLKWQHEGVTTRIQEHAREARYALLRDYCAINGIEHLFFAHHLDDQAETFVYRLSKQSGTDGLAAMAICSKQENITIIRPLLHIHRSQIKQYMQNCNAQWFEDPSNTNTKYTRVKIRENMAVLQQLDITPVKLATMAKKIRRSRDALEFYTMDFIKKYCAFSSMGYVTLDASPTWPPEDILLRALTWILWHVSGSVYPPRQQRVEGLMHKISCINGAVTCGGCYIKVAGGKILFMREIRHQESVDIIHTDMIWDDRFVFRFADSAPHLQIATTGWVKKINQQHALLDKYLIAGLPAIKFNQEIVAVPCLNYYPRMDILDCTSVVEWRYEPKKKLSDALFIIA